MSTPLPGRAAFLDAASWLAGIVRSDATLRALGDGVWSALPAGAPSQPYDGRARLYDRLIGNGLYNRVAWGTSPASYASFAERAVRHGQGPVLDAGCGTLVSTAAAHARSGRPTVLVDLSADMLRAGRERLLALAGGAPRHVVLLQADLLHLPFRDGVFGAVLCAGMAHLFEDAASLTRELARVSAPGAGVFLTSLVADRWLSARYLAALHRAGEVARPRTAAELDALLSAPGSGLAGRIDSRVEGGMAFATARAAGARLPDV